jgi:hypothetical protein
MHFNAQRHIWRRNIATERDLHMRVLDGWHAQGLEPIITASSFANTHT